MVFDAGEPAAFEQPEVRRKLDVFRQEKLVGFAFDELAVLISELLLDALKHGVLEAVHVDLEGVRAWDRPRMRTIWVCRMPLGAFCKVEVRAPQH